jgi:hypothetical protein
MRSCKNDNLHRLRCLLKTLIKIWSDVDSSAAYFFAWEINLQNHIWLLLLNIIHTVNQSFVHVQNQDFTEWRWRKINKFIIWNFVVRYFLHTIPYEV